VCSEDRDQGERAKCNPSAERPDRIPPKAPELPTKHTSCNHALQITQPIKQHFAIRLHGLSFVEMSFQDVG
jgi:hypothetical protein